MKATESTAVPAAGATPNVFEFDALEAAGNYRAALLREFGPHLQGCVLEIGAGVGHLTRMLRALGPVRQVLAVEPDFRFCQAIQASFPDQPVLCGTAAALDAAGDAILSINVLEHIREDEEELKTYHRLLSARSGVLCLFTPARPEIYAPLDRQFGHYRRYTKPELEAKLRAAGFEILGLSYFNWLGYFAWWFGFRILKKTAFDKGAVKFYDRCLFPLVYWMETHVARPPFGQSLIATARAARR